MAGHSHAANVKHRKNAVDAKRAKIFSKLARNIISAVRQGGAEADTNLKLKYAVEKARAANMPKGGIPGMQIHGVKKLSEAISAFDEL